MPTGSSFGHRVLRYSHDFHRLSSQNYLFKTEEKLIAHFVGDLKGKLQEKLVLQTQQTLMDIVGVAEQLEHQSATSRASPASNKGLLPTLKRRNKHWIREQIIMVTKTTFMICLWLISSVIGVEKWDISPMSIPNVDKLNCARGVITPWT